MSDTSMVDVAAVQIPVAAPVLTAGAMLRAARESAGLHVAALAVSMKVPVKKLEALEADRLDLLPDAVFVRALASSVCRSLKIDAAPVLAKLPRNGIPRLDAGARGINAPFRASGDSSAMSLPSLLKRPAAVVVVALLIAAVVVVMVPEFQIEKLSTATSDAVSAEPVKNPQAEAIAPSDVMPAAVAVNVSAAPLMPAVVQTAVAVTPAVVTPTSSVEQVAAFPSDFLVIRARGPSWVEVTDAKGGVQVRRMLAQGEVVKSTGVSPLTVVIGRADMADVEVRGKAFNVTALARDNVARFEVK